jgi:pyruvate decarboxylase
MDATYNDIQDWKYTELCNVFGGERNTRTYQIRTKAQLEQLFSDQEFAEARLLRFVEIYMEKKDAPIGLLKTVKFCES